MKFSAILMGLCLTGTLASPVYHQHHKRAYVTDLTILTKTVYVTVGHHAPTPVPDPAPIPEQPIGGPPREDQDTVQKPPVTTSSRAPRPPRPTSTPAPAPSPQPEPQPGPEPEPEQPAQPQPPSDDFQSLVLYHHNVHRANHSAADLTWDDNLADAARQLAQSCYYQHDTSYNGGGYGQNIGYGYRNIGALLTNAMYNDEMMYFQNLYGQAQPSGNNFAQWGHFTQMVWKKTERVGCYTHVCSSLTDPNYGSAIPNTPFTVCNYGPPGNWAGEYGENVGRPLGHPMIVA
ncbi:hypothetical protein VTO42DRAFT_8101 [Malbranchea cinnamomea]